MAKKNSIYFETEDMKNNLLSLVNNRNMEKEVRLLGTIMALNQHLITLGKAKIIFKELDTFGNEESLINKFKQELEKEEQSFKPDFAIPPSDTIQEIMDNMGLTLSDLSELSNIPLHHLKSIMEAESEICEVSAPQIANALGIDALFLLNLENNYRKNLGRLQDIQERKVTEQSNNSLNERETKLALIALEHYVDCDIDDIERIEMTKLIQKIQVKK